MLTVGMVLFPKLTQLDFTGPYEVLARMPDTRVLVAAAEVGSVVSDAGLALVADTRLADAPPFDVLFVPGGPGVNDRLDDVPFLDALRRQGEQARYVTSVCTGALLLGTAGLLRGYRATTHWLSLDLLSAVGATPVAERVVVDRNRITGGGVTAGIDFALRLAALLHGDAVAQKLQLMLEYHPDPPFAGSPDTADPAVVRDVRANRETLQQERRRKIEQMMRRFSGEAASGAES